MADSLLLLTVKLEVSEGNVVFSELSEWLLLQ